MAGGIGREEMFHKILVFFAVITAITGIFNLAASGDMTLSNFGTGTIPGQVIAGSTIPGYVEGANTQTGTVVTGIDLTIATTVNPNVTTQIGGPWMLASGEGMILQGVPFLAGPLNPSAVIVRNGMVTGDTYYTSAKVRNTPNQDFYVFPRFITGYSGSDLKVVFSSDGVHIKKFPLSFGILDAGDDNFIPYPNAQVTLAGGSTIRTELKEAVSSQTSNVPDYTAGLSIYKDDALIVSNIPVRSLLPGYNINDQVRHGGAGSDSVGFNVMGFPSTSVLDTPASFISGGTGTEADPVQAIVGFMGLIVVFLGLGQDPLVPFWLWGIIAIPCISTLILIYLEMIRGN